MKAEMNKEKEALFILVDVVERLKDSNDKITIGEIDKVIKILIDLLGE